jgi:hypothetical protein
MVSYEAGVNFHVKESAIKVPENLPKNKDIRNTYRTAERIVETGNVPMARCRNLWTFNIRGTLHKTKSSFEQVKLAQDWLRFYAYSF